MRVYKVSRQEVLALRSEIQKLSRKTNRLLRISRRSR